MARPSPATPGACWRCAGRSCHGHRGTPGGRDCSPRRHGRLCDPHPAAHCCSEFLHGAATVRLEVQTGLTGADAAAAWPRSSTLVLAMHPAGTASGQVLRREPAVWIGPPEWTPGAAWRCCRWRSILQAACSGPGPWQRSMALPAPWRVVYESGEPGCDRGRGSRRTRDRCRQVWHGRAGAAPARAGRRPAGPAGGRDRAPSRARAA